MNTMGVEINFSITSATAAAADIIRSSKAQRETEEGRESERRGGKKDLFASITPNARTWLSV